MSERAIIQFYQVKNPYGEFSNFSQFAFTVDGREYPTSEHYFQSKKFEGTEHEEQVAHAATGLKAAEMGRDRARPLRHDWESVKEDVMYQALRYKFKAHKELRDLLLSTGDAVLVEHSSNDKYWADGGDGTGLNRLGVLLEKLRNELRDG